MKTKRTAKWQKKITLTELKHLRGQSITSLRQAKLVFEMQSQTRLKSPTIEPCHECKTIAAKLLKEDNEND